MNEQNDLIGPQSKQTICPSCRTEINTEIRVESSVEAHLLALIFCVFYCFPCSLLPYFMPMCKNTNHYCPNCGALIGIYYK